MMYKRLLIMLFLLPFLGMPLVHAQEADSVQYGSMEKSSGVVESNSLADNEMQEMLDDLEFFSEMEAIEDYEMLANLDEIDENAYEEDEQYVE